MDPRFERLSPEQQKEYLELQAAADVLAERNPLLRFHACERWCGSPQCPVPTERNPLGGRPKQYEFMAAMDRIVLEAAGNRFGKTTANVVWAIIQHTPDELLPERLKVFKRKRDQRVASEPVVGRYIAPSEKALLNIVLPELQRWVPKDILRGKRWDKAYTDKYKVLHFHDGGRLELYTSEQDPKVMVGTALDYVIIDEPTTKPIWGENWVRLSTRRGTARFGLTPVNMVGGGIGWLYHDIYKPGVLGEPFEGTNLVPKVLRADMADNPDMSEQDIAEALAIYDPEEREARKTGEFVAFGGLIYPGFRQFRVPKDKLITPDDPEFRKIIGQQWTVVGIDPSFVRAAIVWIAFNDLNYGLVYQVKYVRKTDPLKLRDAINEGNEVWGLKQTPMYVMDPYAGGAHSMTSGEAVTMRSELQMQGIYTHAPRILKAEAIVYGGISNIKRRMVEGSFAVLNATTIDKEFWLEAEEYRLNPREDGVFEPVKEFDDAMDAMRYAFTQRPWYTRPPSAKPTARAWRPGVAPNAEWIEGSGPVREDPSATGSMT